MEAILHYFFSLSKRLVFLGAACSLAPILLVSLGYPHSTALNVYFTVYACSLPWLLWFQQMYYLGIGHSIKGFIHIRTAFFSSLFCTVLVFFSFPFIPSAGNFSLEAVPPLPNLASGNILSFPEGSLILNPALVFPSAGFPAEAKALWYGGRRLLFTNISTNGETLVLKGAETIQTPFRKDYPQLNASILGRKAASLWVDNMLGFHRKLQGFCVGYGAVYPLRENTAFAEVLPQESKSLSLQQPQFDAYPRLFLAVFGLYLFACFLGILFSLRQHYLGALCLILAASFWGSPHILRGLQQVSYLLPVRYLFEAGLCAVSLLLIGILCGFSFDMPFSRKRRL